MRPNGTTHDHAMTGASAAIPEPSLRVSLDVFDGPLDLLLQLVREQQLDITTVPLAAVAQQYFDYLAVMDALDVELAAEYLVIAATLVFLKSRSLLPSVPNEFLGGDEETPEEVEARLRRRLIWYSKYKNVADELRSRALQAQAYTYREGGDSATDLMQRYRIAPEKLRTAILSAIRNNTKPEKRAIRQDRFSIARQMEFVTRIVRERRNVEFWELCRDLDRSGIIVTFLAVLELIRRRRLGYEQPTPGDRLLLRWEPFEVYAN
jgi:segregation and condensation protein A